MASDVDICNRALQLLGAGSITTLTENSVAARECKRAYELVRNRELRAHTWSFAIAREQLAANATAPLFGFARQFDLPAEYLRLLPVDPADVDFLGLDWQIEGRAILTDDAAPLNIRYVKIIEDTTLFDALFVEALAAAMAKAMAEKLTQSNSKKADAKAAYKDAIEKAKAVNAIERQSADPPTDSWIVARR